MYFSLVLTGKETTMEKTFVQNLRRLPNICVDHLTPQHYDLAQTVNKHTVYMYRHVRCFHAIELKSDYSDIVFLFNYS